MQTEKIYNQDGYCRTFKARVLSCEALAEVRSDGAAFGVILDKTAFFPEGGGQSSDTGNLGNAYVMDVQEINGEIVHMTDVELPVGEELVAELNWEERFRKMQNHTGEHLLSGIVHKQFGYDNVGFHLGTDGMTVDFSGTLTPAELNFVEYVANRVVGLNVPVTVSYPTPEECARMDYRSKLDLVKDVRIVTIEGWDVCACCAPHVTQTGAVGGIKILSCENWKGGIRLHVLCGLDAMDDYTCRIEQTARISQQLSCKQLEVAEAVERVMKASQAEREKSAKLRRVILDMKVSALEATDGNIVMFDDILDNNNLRDWVNAGVQKAGGICAVFQGNDEDGYRYIIGSRSVKLRAWSKDFNAALNGRGGGSDEMIQGTVKAGEAEIQAYLK
ncbi:MAG: alanyl-tRNA editing protein [Oscillospiraceae bacterium]|nr:alanyl-tRNA editing protein [Oscillospiraceae bacterium]